MKIYLFTVCVLPKYKALFFFVVVVAVIVCLSTLHALCHDGATVF